jgi:hypothetical protein
MYQMMIGCAQWAVTLGRFDIQYATNSLARYAQLPRMGHYERAIRMFGYLKRYPAARTKFDPTAPDLSSLTQANNDWSDLYPNAMEEIPEDIIRPMDCGPLRMTVFVDASHANDILTRRSVTGFIMFLGQTPVVTYSKRQNTVESASYGSELVAARIAIENVLAMRYKLRMLGMPVERYCTLICDNQSVVSSLQMPSSSLNKKHNAIAYHKCREAVAAGFIRVAFIRSAGNLADLLTKPLGEQKLPYDVRYLLFGDENTTGNGSRGVTRDCTQDDRVNE